MSSGGGEQGSVKARRQDRADAWESGGAEEGSCVSLVLLFRLEMAWCLLLGKFRLRGVSCWVPESLSGGAESLSQPADRGAAGSAGCFHWRQKQSKRPLRAEREKGDVDNLIREEKA